MYLDYFKVWSDPFFSGNYVDTNRYDIINGEAIERSDYKKKRLEQEKLRLTKLLEVSENAVMKYTEQLEKINKELEPE